MNTENGKPFYYHT